MYSFLSFLKSKQAQKDIKEPLISYNKIIGKSKSSLLGGILQKIEFICNMSTVQSYLKNWREVNFGNPVTKILTKKGWARREKWCDSGVRKELNFGNEVTEIPFTRIRLPRLMKCSKEKCVSSTVQEQQYWNLYIYIYIYIIIVNFVDLASFFRNEVQGSTKVRVLRSMVPLFFFFPF